MKMVVQRVTRASVKVDGETVGEIGRGFLVLLGVQASDTEEMADRMVDSLLDVITLLEELNRA